MADTSWVNDIDWQGLEEEQGLPEGLLKSVAHTESRFNARAYNKDSGAAGAFQFMPATAKAYKIDPMDPKASARAAAKFLGDSYRRYGGDLDKTLASYNWGSGRIQERGMDRMPQETRNYLAQVKKGLAGQFSEPSRSEPSTRLARAERSREPTPAVADEESEAGGFDLGSLLGVSGARAAEIQPQRGQRFVDAYSEQNSDQDEIDQILSAAGGQRNASVNDQRAAQGSSKAMERPNFQTVEAPAENVDDEIDRILAAAGGQRSAAPEAARPAAPAYAPSEGRAAILPPPALDPPSPPGYRREEEKPRSYVTNNTPESSRAADVLADAVGIPGAFAETTAAPSAPKSAADNPDAKPGIRAASYLASAERPNDEGLANALGLDLEFLKQNWKTYTGGEYTDGGLIRSLKNLKAPEQETEGGTWKQRVRHGLMNAAQGVSQLVDRVRGKKEPQEMQYFRETVVPRLFDTRYYTEGAGAGTFNAQSGREDLSSRMASGVGQYAPALAAGIGAGTGWAPTLIAGAASGLVGSAATPVEIEPGEDLAAKRDKQMVTDTVLSAGISGGLKAAVPVVASAGRSALNAFLGRSNVRELASKGLQEELSTAATAQRSRMEGLGYADEGLAANLGQAGSARNRQARDALADMRSAETPSEVVQASLGGRKLAAQDKADQLYAAVRQMEPTTTPATPTNLAQTMKQVVGDMRESYMSQGMSPLVQVLDRAAEDLVVRSQQGVALAKLPISKLERMRSDLGKAMEQVSSNTPIASYGQRYAAQLREAIDRDISAWGKATPENGQAAELLSEARRVSREEVYAPFTGQAGKTVMGREVNDRAIEDMLAAAARGDKGKTIGGLYNTLDPKGQQAFRSGLLDRLVRQSVETVDGQPAAFSAEKLVAQLSDKNSGMSTAVRTAFRGSDRFLVDGLKKTALAIADIPKAQKGLSGITRLALGGVAGAGTFATTKNPELAVAASAATGALADSAVQALRGVTRVMFESPKGRNLVLRVSGAKAGSPGMAKAVQDLLTYSAKFAPVGVAASRSSAGQDRRVNFDPSDVGKWGGSGNTGNSGPSDGPGDFSWMGGL